MSDLEDGKLEYNFLIRDVHLELLQAAAQKYDLTDENKALRVILDYVNSEGDPEEIFGVKRCLHC